MIICVDCGQEKEHCALGLCKACYERQWRRKNPEKSKAIWKRWQEKNRDKIAAKDRRYREQHQERKRAYDCRYRQTHKEERRASFRRWQKEHQKERNAYARRWRRQNLDRARAIDSQRRARRHSTPNGLTIEEAERLFSIGSAVYPGEQLHLDHVVPLSKGGGTTLANIHAIPASVNRFKSNKLPQEVYGQLLLSPHKPREEKKHD